MRGNVILVVILALAITATARELTITHAGVISAPTDPFQMILVQAHDGTDIRVNAFIPELGIKAPQQIVSNEKAYMLLPTEGLLPGEYVVMITARSSDRGSRRTVFRFLNIE